MRSVTLVVFAAVAVVFAAEPGAVHNIVISADIPTVAVAPRRPGRTPVHLPSVTYAMTLTADCDENWQASSVSISVADSSMSFDTEKLQEVSVLEFDLQIPSSQIAPFQVENFCIRNDADGTARERLAVSAVLLAQGSLRCASESRESIKYVTKPLDIVLECGLSDPTED